MFVGLRTPSCSLWAIVRQKLRRYHILEPVRLQREGGAGAPAYSSRRESLSLREGAHLLVLSGNNCKVDQECKSLLNNL